MLVREDKYYLNLWKDIKDIGFTIEKISRFDFHKMDNKKALEFLDWLEDNYIMYQYKNETRDQYKNHELFFWSNGSTDYFRISLNNKISFERWGIITEQILNYIKNNCSDIDGEIALHYQNCIDYDKVNNYILKTNFDINNLPFNELRVITKNCGDKGRTVCGSLLSEESKNKLYELEQELLKSLVNKKVIYNGMKGTIKPISDYYGFFKQRATRTYYNVMFERIAELKLA